jgi:prepilin-type N-terminal cleavage/methylation domain-containing protein
MQRTRSDRSPRGHSARGFTLIELMVVVVIIAIASSITIPSMIEGRNEARTYANASLVAGMLREARARAIARGAGVSVAMTTNGATDRGTFVMSEAVDVAGPAGIPQARCNAPPAWNQVATFGFNSGIDITTGMLTTILAPGGIAATAATICFTPLGRTFMSWNTAGGNVPLAPLTGAFRVQIVRTGSMTATDIPAAIAAGALSRSVLVPSTGAARVTSP